VHERHVEHPEIRAHDAGLLGPVQELHGDRRDAVASHRDPLTAPIPGEQRLLEPAVLRLQTADRAHERLERVPRVVDLERLAGDRLDVGDLVLEEGVDERVLVGEAPVHRAHADTGRDRDVVQRHVEAALGEHPGRGLEDPRAVALGVGAQRTVR
jgi:hypothetical protein